MDPAELRLTYEQEPADELGELFATVRSGAFAGWGSAWFKRAELKQTFTTPLRAFPLNPSALPVIDGEERLRIAISPIDSRGTLVVRVDVASPRFDMHQQYLQHALTVRFLTNYSDVARFAEHLDKMLDGAAEEVVLKGS